MNDTTSVTTATNSLHTSLFRIKILREVLDTNGRGSDDVEVRNRMASEVVLPLIFFE